MAPFSSRPLSFSIFKPSHATRLGFCAAAAGQDQQIVLSVLWTHSLLVFPLRCSFLPEGLASATCMLTLGLYAAHQWAWKWLQCDCGMYFTVKQPNSLGVQIQRRRGTFVAWGKTVLTVLQYLVAVVLDLCGSLDMLSLSLVVLWSFESLYSGFCVSF